MRRTVTLSVVALALLAAPFALSTGAAQAPQSAADPNVWSIDTNHSAANFAVKHMLVSTVRGTLGPIKGAVTWDGKNISSVKADVNIDVNGISTENAGRDTHLKSADFFDAANHPTITFKSTRVQPGAGGAFKLVGDLTIRGTTKEVTLDVEAPAAVVAQPGRNGGAPTYRTGTTATTTVNRFDYGLKWNNLIEAGGGAVVSADVKVTLDLELTRR
ncbi:MAG: YceI family protein [Acidobacteria bacterium]|nr:YceI family protein [Acidobacteriota bacterium]